MSTHISWVRSLLRRAPVGTVHDTGLAVVNVAVYFAPVNGLPALAARVLVVHVAAGWSRSRLESRRPNFGAGFVRRQVDRRHRACRGFPCFGDLTKLLTCVWLQARDEFGHDLRSGLRLLGERNALPGPQR